MSNLYARLKTASARAKTAEEKPPERKSCAMRRLSFDPPGEGILSQRDLDIICAMEGIAPPPMEDVVFLDTETTGLGRGAGTVAFLVGIGLFSGERFCCRQFWMRGYDEEEDLLLRISEIIAGKLVISFNGKSFDIPLLEGRFVMNRLRFPAIESVDLLTHARRIYRLRLKRVRLSYLEEMILGEPRVDDLPGAEVPGRYFDFLKTGDEALLDEVFQHNALDVFSMGRIMRKMAQAYETPHELAHGKDIFSVGKVYEKLGNSEKAEACYRLSKEEYRLPSISRLSLLYKRGKRFDEAMAGFMEIAGFDASANVELAKHYEHRLKDYHSALDHTDRAIALEEREYELELLFARRKRLLIKINKSEADK
ncbi:MAG: ribonuclease H-like domain-containing protein [Christensenellales bacterium]|jgi:uncharacterized protein YprB with RNaseH-like and TPR domain